MSRMQKLHYDNRLIDDDLWRGTMHTTDARTLNARYISDDVIRLIR
jgi:hypothetical protein